jgi:PilZ domain
MPSDMTVVVADTTQAVAIRAGLLFSGHVRWFTGGHLVSALESIQMHHPKLIAVEAAFAQTPQGQAFITRIEGLAIRGSVIQLVLRADGRWTTTPHKSQPAAAESQAVVDSGADRQVAETVTAQTKGTNTRRARRFQVLESLKAVVENGQANLVDISILGAQVVSGPALRPTQKVKIVLPDADDMVHLTAHVAWSTFEQRQPGTQPHYRAGMEFTGAAQEILEDYCRRHCSPDPLPSY